MTRKPHQVTQGGLRDTRSSSSGVQQSGTSSGLNQSTARSAADLPVAQNTPYGSGVEGRQIGGTAPYTENGSALPTGQDKTATNGLSFSNQVDGAFQPTRQI